MRFGHIWRDSTFWTFPNPGDTREAGVGSHQTALQSTKAGKPRVVYPSTRRILARIFTLLTFKIPLNALKYCTEKLRYSSSSTTKNLWLLQFALLVGSSRTVLYDPGALPAGSDYLQAIYGDSGKGPDSDLIQMIERDCVDRNPQVRDGSRSQVHLRQCSGSVLSTSNENY